MSTASEFASTFEESVRSQGYSAIPGWVAWVLQHTWLAAAAAVPLALNPWGYNAFELPKALLLRMLVLLMALAGLVQYLETRRAPHVARWRRPVLPLFGPVLLFGCTAVLATLFSVNPRLSLWGSYERQQGLLTLGTYLALFLLTAANLRTRAQVERLLSALIWGSAAVVVYGLLQAAGLNLLGWRTDAISPVLSTVGRANFLGSYLVLITPLTAGRLLLARRRWPYTLLLAGQLACLALTQTRGAWLGLGAALIIALLAWAITSRDRRPAFAALTLIVLAVGFLALLSMPNADISPLVRLPGMNRLATLADTGSGSTAARLTIWRATLPLIAGRPLLGYGPETMSSVFARDFPPQLVYYQGRHVMVDRAHNLWLDLGIGTGLAGLAAFCVLMVSVGRRVWRGLRDSSDRPTGVLWIALAAAVAGHLVDLQFGFDLTTTSTIFWLLLAIVAASETKKTLPVSRQAEVGNPGRLLYIIPPALLTLALVGQVCVRPLLADVAYQQSREATGLPGEQLKASARAVGLWSLEPVYRMELAWASLRYGNPAATEAQLASAARLSPGDPRLWAERGAVYAFWGRWMPEQYAQAEAAYRQALELAPNVAAYHVALGVTLARQGEWEEGITQLKRAVALDATDSVAYRHLADLHRAMGQEPEAAWAQRQAERWERETTTQ